MTAPKPVGAAHKWVITIVGGIIVGIVGAYFIHALNLNPATTPNPPSKRAALVLTVNTDAVTISAPGVVVASLQGGTPNNGAEFDLIDPSGATQVGSGTRLDDQGAAEFEMDFGSLVQPLATGTWLVSVVDRGSGAFARVPIQVG